MPQFYYGTYTHDDKQVAFTNISRTFVRGSTRRPHMLHVSWGIRGKIIRPTTAEIWTEYSRMQLAYMQDGGSAGFDGTPFTINNSFAVGGVRVTSPISHDAIEGAGWATFLPFKAGLEADFLVAGPLDVLDFSEQIEFKDNMGLPHNVERLPLNADPLLQTVSKGSWYYATQSGSRKQVGPNPQPMLPIFPNNMRTQAGNARGFIPKNPEMIKGVPVSYSCSWRYEFVSAFPLIGFPNALG